MNNDIARIEMVYSKYGLKVTKAIEGLRVNTYILDLPYNIDVNKLLKLQKNLVIALNENNIRVYQDGSNLVIERATNKGILKFDDIFYRSMYERNKDMRLVLGKDLQGNSIVTSLKKAPHILVSGCTGSGKTQLLHCFISSLLLGNNPCQMILIDPKGNEFNVYERIDTVDFITDIPAALNKLRWLVDEMNARYKEMAELHVTDVDQTRFSRIVCVIDEFADLIKRDKSIEQSVVLLAQKARGCGIHLVIATQYPKVEVLTGLIQANIPTRVCLKVNSIMQSRVALERTGGEKLLGRGDLLFLGDGMYNPMRIQAPYISQQDKLKVAAKAAADLKGLGLKNPA